MCCRKRTWSCGGKRANSIRHGISCPGHYGSPNFRRMAHLKRQKRVPMTFDEPLLAVLADEAIAETAELDPRRHALARCLQKLPDQQRQLIARRYEPGGSVNELARRSGKSAEGDVGNVATHPPSVAGVHRADGCSGGTDMSATYDSESGSTAE